MRKNLLSGLSDLLFPDSLYCICCNKIIDDTRPYHLCNDCMDNIKWVDNNHCDICGKRLSASNPRTICYSCSENSHIFRKGYTCTEYGEHERAIIFALKYGERPDIARSIGEIIRDRMEAEIPQPLYSLYDLLVPVPMYMRKQRQRGYNQAELICREVAKLTGIGYHGEILLRTRATRALKGLAPDERREEIRGVFKLRSAADEFVSGARILLIDDIYTTGATMDEAAATLNAAGAESVDILSFAAGADVVK